MTFGEPIPFEEAIAIAQSKGLLPNDLSSAQLSVLDQQLKQRAVFSARLDKAEVLQVLLDNLEAIVSGLRDERGVYRSIPEAKAQLREAMLRAGVPFAPVGTAKIKDFYSDTRRDLIVRTNVLDTMGFGQHVALQGSLYSVPAQKLVRTRVPKGGAAAMRPWVRRWHDAMDAIGSDAESGCTIPEESGGIMAALINHPIWQALGNGAGGYGDALGNPWAPFAFNSGMSLTPISRAQAVALGLIGIDEEIEPETHFDMNENLEASVAKFSGALQGELNKGGLKILDGVLKIANRRAGVFRARQKLRGLLHELQEAA